MVLAENGPVDLIYHLALSTEWSESVDLGEPYARSTLGRSLTEEGFIHCSFANQVRTIADLVYKGRGDVVLLVIDPCAVPAEIRIENCDGGEELFPHIYGSLPITAVIRADPVPITEDGTLDLTGLL
jgi:glutathione S-transferase